MIPHGHQASLLGCLEQGILHVVVLSDPLATNPAGHGVVPEIACLGTTPAHRALSRGQEHEESQTALGSKHKFLFCQVEAEGLKGEGREPVPYSP